MLSCPTGSPGVSTSKCVDRRGDDIGDELFARGRFVPRVSRLSKLDLLYAPGSWFHETRSSGVFANMRLGESTSAMLSRSGRASRPDGVPGPLFFFTGSSCDSCCSRDVIFVTGVSTTSTVSSSKSIGTDFDPAFDPGFFASLFPAANAKLLSFLFVADDALVGSPGCGPSGFLFSSFSRPS